MNIFTVLPFFSTPEACKLVWSKYYLDITWIVFRYNIFLGGEGLLFACENETIQSHENVPGELFSLILPCVLLLLLFNNNLKDNLNWLK